MDYIKRPKEVEKGQKKYLSNEFYQDLVNAQLKVIYDKIDEIINYINNH